MDRELTNEMLERCKRFGTEMEAFRQGIAIQVKVPTGWISEFNPTWSFNCQYRVKPEPLECWVTVYNDHLPSTVHPSKEGALKVATTVPGPAPPSVDKGWTVRKFREVIE